MAKAKLGYWWVMTNVGDDIETGRSTDSDYWAELVERKSKQTAIDNRPKAMSSPINNLAYQRPVNSVSYLILKRV